MKNYIIIFGFICLSLFGCKNSQKNQTLNTTINYESNKIKNQNSIESDKLPFGVKIISNINFNSLDSVRIDKALYKQHNLMDYLNSNRLFKLNEFFNIKYIPSDSLVSLKNKSLFDEIKNNNLSNVIYYLPNFDNFHLLIYNSEPNLNASMETFLFKRTDLVILNKNFDIINEFNIGYFLYGQEREEFKYYFIDEGFNIYIRYFDERIKNSKFSKLHKYKILKSGKIVEQN